MMKILLRLWRTLPLWVHIVAAKMVRPKFRAAVAAMIFDEQGRILLFKHTYRKYEWGIPAGGLEYGEQPEHAILREFFEETGIQIRVDKLLLADSLAQDRHLSLIYLCTIIGGEFRESNEISTMQYFEIANLPFMLLTEKDLIRRVAAMLPQAL